MKKRLIGILLSLALLLALCPAALAAEAPELAVDGEGGVSASATEGENLFLASYDPLTGQFLGIVDPAENAGGGNMLLKAIQTDGEYLPVSDSRTVLVIAEEGTEIEGGAYDEVVVTAALGDGAVTLRDVTATDITLYGGDVTLDAVTAEAVTLGKSDGAFLMTAGSAPAGGSGVSLHIINQSGVGSVLIGQAGDGGVTLRTEEGCRVSWVYVDDGEGAVYLEGSFNQVVVDTDTPVTLSGAAVSGLSLRGENASVALEGNTSVSALEIQESASGAALTAGAGSRVASLASAAESVTVSGPGSILLAQVSGSGSTIDTVGTFLTVAEGTAGVTQNSSAVTPGETVKTGAAPAETHVHRWTEAAPPEDGSVTLVCDCGETMTIPVSQLPYTVYPEEGEPLRFASIEEAMEAAEDNPHSDDPYPIYFTGKGSLGDLALPEDHYLVVLGRLTLAGRLDLGGALEIIGGELVIGENGELRLGWGGSLENAGILNITGRLYTFPGESRSVTRDAGTPEQEETATPGNLTVTGTGILTNTGEVDMEGGGATLSGAVVNRGEMRFREAPLREVTVELESVEGEPAEGEDWWDYDWENPGHYWRVIREERTAEETIPCAVAIGGVMENYGHLSIQSARLTVARGATLNNRDNMEAFREDSGEFPGLLFSDPKITVEGILTNGAVTNVGGQFDGGWAWFHQNRGVLQNRGSIVNNADMSLALTDYVQASTGSMVTYNTAGLRIYGSGLTVPRGAEFRNEGYMNIVDPYGTDALGEEKAPCDLSGFPDFFTTWNQEGNDSHWCDYTAEVYDFRGFKAANAEQARRIEAWESASGAFDGRYNQLRFAGDITLEEDTVLDLFRDYWMDSHEEAGWIKWDEETQRDIPADDDDPEAWYGTYWVGSTLTVPAGVTLTVAMENALRVDGMQDRFSWFEPNVLKVEGNLILEAGQEGTEENGWEDRDSALVEIWSAGSFLCTGTVDNRGDFEIRCHEAGTWNEETWDADYDGTFFRPAECPVEGAPENAVYAAEVRTETGLRNAAASGDPAWHRVYIREDCVITLAGEDLTLPMDMNIEPGSGLTLGHGCTLTLEGHLWNGGDVSILGDLVISDTGSMDNNQNLSLGAFGTEAGRLLIHGYMETRDYAALQLLPSGEIVLYDGGEFLNWEELLTVTLAGTPRALRGARVGTPLTLSEGDFDFTGCVLEGALTVEAAPDSNCDVYLDDCEFLDDVLIHRGDGSGELWVEFFDNARFALGKKVIVTGAPDMDMDAALEREFVLMGVAGLTVESTVSLRASCMMPARFTLNGVAAELIGEPGTFSLRFEPREGGDIYPVFQVDGGEVKLSGTLPEDFRELRLMQGSVDIRELSVGETEITLSNMWGDIRALVGNHRVVLNESGEGSLGKFILSAESGAEICVRYGVMYWDDEEGTYSYSTGVWAETGEADFFLSPHIFGTRDESVPGIFIGTDDERVTYGLRLEGAPLEFSPEVHADGEEKTHLLRPEGDSPWFTAGEGDSPALELTIHLPGDVTVVFDPVPVKPEWRETEP